MWSRSPPRAIDAVHPLTMPVTMPSLAGQEGPCRRPPSAGYRASARDHGISGGSWLVRCPAASDPTIDAAPAPRREDHLLHCFRRLGSGDAAYNSPNSVPAGETGPKANEAGGARRRRQPPPRELSTGSQGCSCLDINFPVFATYAVWWCFSVAVIMQIAILCVFCHYISARVSRCTRPWAASQCAL